MPAEYLKIRDECIARKKKKNGGKISDKQIAECKKMASIVYFKKTGKPVQHADASEIGLDEVDLAIMVEQLDFFGSEEAYKEWKKEVEIDDSIPK